MTVLSLPALLKGHVIKGTDNARAAAVDLASNGCASGTFVCGFSDHSVTAALVLAPEVPQSEAVAVFPMAQVAFQNAFGAVAPPEIHVQFSWDGQIFFNDGQAGHMNLDAPRGRSDAVPDWMVVSLTLWWDRIDLRRPSDRKSQTTVIEEAGQDVSQKDLMETWARFLVRGLYDQDQNGPNSVAPSWSGLLRPTVQSAEFIGLGDDMAAVVRFNEGAEPSLVPLDSLINGGPF